MENSNLPFWKKGIEKGRAKEQVNSSFFQIKSLLKLLKKFPEWDIEEYADLTSLSKEKVVATKAVLLKEDQVTIIEAIKTLFFEGLPFEGKGEVQLKALLDNYFE